MASLPNNKFQRPAINPSNFSLLVQQCHHIQVIHLSLSPSLSLCMEPWSYLSVSLPIWSILSIYPSVYQSIYRSINRSVHLAFLFVYLSSSIYQCEFWYSSQPVHLPHQNHHSLSLSMSRQYPEITTRDLLYGRMAVPSTDASAWDQNYVHHITWLNLEGSWFQLLHDHQKHLCIFHRF